MTKGREAVACRGEEQVLGPDRKSTPGANPRDEAARRVQVREQLRRDIDIWLKRSAADPAPGGVRARKSRSKSG